MLINLHIISDYLSFHPGRHLISDPVLRTLNKPAIPTGKELQKDTVYILDPQWLEQEEIISSEIKLFFTAPPPEDPRLSGMDYLYAVTSSLEPVELLQELYGIFQKFNAWELALHQALLKKNPIQAVGDCSLDFLRNPFCLCTPSFFILQYWEKILPNYTPLYHTEDKNNYVSLDDANTLLLFPDFVNTWNTNGPQYFHSPDGEDATNLYQNIKLHGRNIARIFLNDYVSPYRDSDLPVLDFFTQFIARAIQMDDTPYITSHPPYLDDLLLKLAAGEACDDAVLNASVAPLGWRLEDPFLCARVSAPQDNSIGSVGHACMRLETMFNGCCVLNTKKNLLMLVNLRTSDLSRNQVISSLNYIQREFLMKIGYSYEFQNIRNLHTHDVQANIALELGEEFDPHIWTYRFETYVLHYCVRNILGKLDAHSLCHPGLLKLLEYDKNKKTNFSNTLRIYLENNMKVTQTIRKVYLQRASFQYQLQKIIEIADVNLDDFETRLYLLLSFQLLDLEKSNSL